MADHCLYVALVTVVVVPLQVLESTTSLKIVRKVHEALRHIMTGLIFNSDMNAESLLLLSHGLISENLPLLTEKAKWVPGCYPDGLLPVRRFACRNGSSEIQLIKFIRVSLLLFDFCFQCEWMIWAVRGQGESLEMGEWSLPELMGVCSCKCSGPSVRLFHHLVSWYMHLCVWMKGRGALFRREL